MSIEHYFRSSSMEWFREGQDSRYSSFHWDEINNQTLAASQIVHEACERSLHPRIAVVGFGFGRETELLLEQGVAASIIGLDINLSRFHEAKEIRPDIFTDQINPIAASMNNSPFGSETFDAVLRLETMMHSDNPARTLGELTRITKPEGVIVFNMSTTHGSVHDFLQMLSIEGVPRIIERFKERMLQDKDSSSRRTKLYTQTEIENLIQGNVHTEVVQTANYLKGLSTYVVLRKII
jgi:ubiquinone/menaquinone biosynthesis C-methylase UbiE